MNCINCGAPHEPGMCSYCLTPNGGTEWLDVTTVQDSRPRYVAAGGIANFSRASYPAILHRGESLIPARQAAVFSSVNHLSAEQVEIFRKWFEGEYCG